MKILGLSGSLRKNSLNTAVLRAAVSLATPPVQIEVRGLQGIPVYDGDLEEEHGLPAAVEELKDAIASADGLWIATPEYNGSLPGPLKNGLDWCTRPTADMRRVFGDKPVALSGATPGRLGTALAQTAWLPVLRSLGLRLWTSKQLLVPSAHGCFDANGELTDEKLRARLGEFVAGFAEFCAR